MSGEHEGPERERPERERSEEEAQADLEVPKETSEQVRGGAEAATSDKFAQSAEGVSGGELIIEL